MGLDKKLSMGTTAKASIFYKLIYKPSYCIFQESRKKSPFFFIIIILSAIICFVAKNICLGSVCVILRVTLLNVIVLSISLGKI